MKIKDIAKFLNKSTTHVSFICKKLKEVKTQNKVHALEVSLTINQYLKTENVSKHKFTL